MFFIDNLQRIERALGVKVLPTPGMCEAIRLWRAAASDRPPWYGEDGCREALGMARHIADTRAALAVLDIGISVSGRERAKYLQRMADRLLERLPERLADAGCAGGMIIKWNGAGWDFIMQGDFGVTAADSDGGITGAVFAAHTVQDGAGYVRLEAHSLDPGGEYTVVNRAFRTGPGGGDWREVPLSSVSAWSSIRREVRMNGVKAPLFGFYRVPGAGPAPAESPFGRAVFANALTELRAIDKAFSRKCEEITDSRHVTFVGQALISHAKGIGEPLPRFVKGLGMGLGDSELSAIHEHVPTLLTEDRIRDLNFDLSVAGVKCGFSAGTFVLDGRTGALTATQVEADDRDTVRTVKTDRDALKAAITQAMAGLDAFADLTDSAPGGEYTLSFNFGDVTYNYEEDKRSWQSYVDKGWVPAWYYLVKFEGLSREEAMGLCER